MTSKKENILRSAEINLNRKLTSEESKNILDNPNLMQDMLKSRLLSSSHSSMQNSLNDMEERHKDLLNLERNVKEIHKMFIDLALLVSLQGEMIDNIEANVKTAKESVVFAEEHLVISKNNLSSARKVIKLILFFLFLKFIFLKNC